VFAWGCDIGLLLTHCKTLKYTAAYCNTLQHVLQHTLQHTPQHTSIQLRKAVFMGLRYLVADIIATHCNTLQPTHCKSLQHAATRCNRAEKEVFSWGYDVLLLLVEADNT